MTSDEDRCPGAGPGYPLARGGLEEGCVLECVAHIHRDQDSSAYLPLSNGLSISVSVGSHLE